MCLPRAGVVTRWLGIRNCTSRSFRGQALASYLRTLLIHGARAVLQAARMKQRRGQALDPLQAWALDLQQRQGHNKAAVGLANKLARRLWATEHHGARFDAHHVSERPQAC